MQENTKYSLKYSRSTVPFDSSNPMWQGPTNVPRTEPLSGVGSLTLRLPVESPWTRSVERRQSNCLNSMSRMLERGCDWDILRPLWTFAVTCMGVMLKLLESGFLVEGVLGCLAMYGYPSILVSSPLLQLWILWIDDRQAYSSRPLRLLGFKYAPTLNF